MEKGPAAKEAKVNVTLRLPKDTIDRCDELIARLSAAPGAFGVSRGEFLRRALELGCDAIEATIPKAKKTAGR